MKNQWLISLLFIGALVGTASAQEFQISEKGDLRRGREVTALMVATSSKPITITAIEPASNEGFNVEVPKCPCSVEGTQTFLVKVSRPFWTGFGGPNAGQKTITLIVNYTVDGKPNNKPVHYSFIYRTAATVYYLAGFVGLLLGYIVKSILTMRAEKPEDSQPQVSVIQYLFIKNWTKLFVVLVLGFVVLLYSDLQGTTVFGFRESIILGLATGLLGDEGLLQKVGALGG